MSNYPPPPYQYQSVRQNSTTAVVSIVMAILGLTIIPVVGSVIAVVTGHMAKSEIARSGGMLSGDGAATWGLVLGYVGIGFFILGICGFLTVFFGFCTLPLFLVPLSDTGNSFVPFISAMI